MILFSVCVKIGLYSSLFLQKYLLKGDRKMKKLYEEPMLLQIDVDANIDTVDVSTKPDGEDFGGWIPL